MGKTKKILSFLIALIMVLALVPFNTIVYAVDVETGDEAQTQTEASTTGESVEQNIAVIDADGNATYYEGFTGFKDLDLANCTIKLLNDVSDANLILNKGEESKVVDVNVVLDLNGFTFARTGSTSGAINLTNGSSLTIKDTSAEKTGKIITDTYAVWIMNGDLTIEGGTIETTSAKNAALYLNSSETVISGGKIISAGNAITVGDNFIESKGTSNVAISGGEIEVAGNIIVKGGYAQEETKVAVTGGTFSKDVSDYCADGFECKANADGTFGVAEKNSYVAMIGENGYETLEAAIAAAQNGETIVLLADIAIADTIIIEKSITLDGNGHKITPADATKTYSSAIMAGNSGWRDDHGETIKLVNLEITGFTSNYGVVRVQGVTFEMDGCSINNTKTLNSAYGTVALTYADSTVKNSRFESNEAPMVINVNYNGDDSTAVVIVDGCEFKGNTCNGVGVIYKSDADHIVVNDCDFIGNTVSVASNGAVVYTGWGSGDEVTNCRFDSNTVTTTHATTKRFASAIFCDGCEVTGNIFKNNTAVRNGEAISTIVAVGAYYGAADVSGNYWGGSAPVLGIDYTVEFTIQEVALESYYADEELTELVAMAEAVAEVNGVKYTSLQAAIDAAQAGDTIVVISDVANGETVTLNGVNLTVAEGVTLTNNGTIEVYGTVALNIPKFAGNSIDLCEGAIVKDSNVNGPAYVAGNVTFRGKNTFTMITDYGDYYSKATPSMWTVEKGASLTLTKSDRYGLGYGDKVTVYGSIEDALNARENLTDSDASINMYGGLVGMTNSAAPNAQNKFTAEDAYLIFGVVGDKSFGNKPGSYYGNYEFVFTNSVVTANGFKFYEDKGTSSVVFVDSDLLVNGVFMTNDVSSSFSFTNCVIVSKATSNGSDDKNQNAGAMTLIGTSLTYNAPFTNAGTIVLDLNSSITAPSLVGAGSIIIDATGFNGTEVKLLNIADMEGFTGTVSVENCNNAQYTIRDDGIYIVEKEADPVAEVNGTYYATVQEAIDAAQAGETVVLLADITLTEGVTVTGTVTLDLNGKTISTSIESTITKSFALITNRGTLTIKGDGKISVAYSGASFGYGIGLYTISNSGGTLNVEGGRIENLATVSGSMYDAIDNNSTLGNTVLNISGGDIYCAYIAIRQFANSTTGVNAVNVTGGKIEGGNCSIWTQNPGSTQPKASIAIENGNFTGRILVGISDNFAAAITGGTFTTDVSDYCADGFVCVDNGDGTFGVEKDIYAIGSLEDLKAFRDLVNAGDKCFGETWYLVADIDLLGEEWTPIGTNSNPFQGTFDGRGYKISNLVITGRNDMVGLFGRVNNTGGALKNLTIHNAKVSGDSQIGALVGTPGTFVISNIKVTGHVEIDGYQAVGAVGGKNANANWDNVIVDVDDTSFVKAISTVNGSKYTTHVGGVIGMNGEMAHSLTNISSNIKVIGDVKYIGGLFGTVNASNTIENVTFTGTVEALDGATHVGAIAGVWVNTYGKEVIINNATFDEGIVKVGDNVLADKIVGGTYYSYDTADTSGVLKVDGVQKWPLAVKIDGAYYATLQAAINAAQEGETVVLLAPVVVAKGETLTIDKNVTITYTSNVAGEDMFTVRGNLVINKGTIVYTNTDTTASNVTVSTISAEPGSTVTINGGTVKNDSANNGAKGIYAYAIDLLTNGNLGDVTVTINGGTVYSTNYMAIRQFNNGTACKNTLVVNGGEIYGAKRAIQVHMDNNAAYTTISGGKVEAGNYALCLFNTTAENLSVTGGEFVGEVWFSGTEGFITGGTFTTDVSDYCADGFVCVDNGDGTYGVEEKPAYTEVTFGGASVVLKNNISINQYINNSTLVGTDYYAVIIKGHTDSCGEAAEQPDIIPFDKWGRDSNGNYFVAASVYAFQMNCPITFAIYAGDGTLVSIEKTTSVVAYAKVALDPAYASQFDANFKTLIVDMLNYGAEAQTYFKHDVTNLANGWLTEEQKSYATPDEAVAELDKITTKEEGVVDNALFGASIQVHDTIVVNYYYIGLENYDPTKLFVKYNVSHYYGETHNVTLTGDTLPWLDGNAASGTLHVQIGDLAPADFNTNIEIGVYYEDANGELVALSHILTHDIETLCAVGIEAGGDAVAVYEALAKYAMSAKKYFKVD